MRRKEEMELVRIEKTQIDQKRNRRTVRVYQRKPRHWLSREVLRWTIVIASSIAIGVHWGQHL